jgi:hypothetical protein
MYQNKISSTGMITIVNGNGGNNEGLAKGWINPQPSWYVPFALCFCCLIFHEPIQVSQALFHFTSFKTNNII